MNLLDSPLTRNPALLARELLIHREIQLEYVDAGLAEQTQIGTLPEFGNDLVRLVQ